MFNIPWDLHYICDRKVEIEYYMPQAYVPSKLNLSKDTKLHEYCDCVFGINPPYWDDHMKNAILTAWFGL